MNIPGGMSGERLGRWTVKQWEGDSEGSPALCVLRVIPYSHRYMLTSRMYFPSNDPRFYQSLILSCASGEFEE